MTLYSVLACPEGRQDRRARFSFTYILRGFFGPIKTDVQAFALDYNNVINIDMHCHGTSTRVAMVIVCKDTLLS
jgi:hypothetical protein